MKALLLTAAASVAGILAAQAQVYSVNVVGFVNIDLEAGYNMIANPLNGTNNLLSTIIPNPPDATTVSLWNGEAGDPTATYLGGGAWDPDFAVNPGEGMIVFVGAPTRLTFVGEVPQGSLTNKIVTNFDLLASQVPQRGLLATDLGFTPVESDLVTAQWNPALGATGEWGLSATYLGQGVWDPSEPELEVGEAFMLFRANIGPGTDEWVRNFTVQ